MANKIYTAHDYREMAKYFRNVSNKLQEDTVKGMLLQAAEMRERAENRINELGKCSLYEEKNGGTCPAWRGEEVTFDNCLDESCSCGAIIAELRDLLCGAAEKEKG